MLYVVIRDGLPPGSTILSFGFILLFVIGALLLLLFVSKRPITTVTVSEGIVKVEERYPFRVLRGTYRACDLREYVMIFETTDSDGDAYFYCQIILPYPFIRPVTLAQGSREHCIKVRDRFANSVL